jgi:hypothetical protein
MKLMGKKAGETDFQNFRIIKRALSQVFSFFFFFFLVKGPFYILYFIFARQD